VKSGSVYVKQRPFYTYRRIHFTSGIASFFNHLYSVIIQEGCMLNLLVFKLITIQVKCLNTLDITYLAMVNLCFSLLLSLGYVTLM